MFALKRLSGVETIEAVDGVDAYRKLTSYKFDLLLVDINMPIMDGLKFINIIKDNPNYKDIPIIIITTEGGKEDKEKALSYGVNAYITKPVQVAQMLSIVKELLKIT